MNAIGVRRATGVGSAAPGAIEHRLDGELGAGVLPGAVLAAVAGGEVDRGAVGEVEREPGHLRAAAAAAVAGVTVLALGQGAEGCRCRHRTGAAPPRRGGGRTCGGRRAGTLG